MNAPISTISFSILYMPRLARSRQITRGFNAPAKMGPEQPMIYRSSGCAFSRMTVKDVKSHHFDCGKTPGKYISELSNVPFLVFLP